MSVSWGEAAIPTDDGSSRSWIHLRPSAVQCFALRNLYSITSSARSTIDCGTVRPSDLAVLRFTANSNFVGS